MRGIARSVVFEMRIYPERVNKLNCVAFVLVYFIAGNTRTVVYSSIKIYTSNILLYIWALIINSIWTHITTNAFNHNNNIFSPYYLLKLLLVSSNIYKIKIQYIILSSYNSLKRKDSKFHDVISHVSVKCKQSYLLSIIKWWLHHLFKAAKSMFTHNY